MTIAHAQGCREVAQPWAGERVFFDTRDDRIRQPAGGVDRAQAGCAFRTAAQTRPVTGALGRRGARIKMHVLAFGRPRRADGPAVDSGRRYRDEKAAVETPIARSHRAVTGIGVEQHAVRVANPAGEYSPFSDMDTDGGLRSRARLTQAPAGAGRPR